MSVTANCLIEKYAELLEEGEGLDQNEMVDRTFDIIAMLSLDPSLNTVMDKINTKLHAILANADELKRESVMKAKNSKNYAAEQIRMLKISEDHKSISDLIH